MYKDWGVAVIVGLILLIIVVVIFFVWLFWTFAGMIMDYIGATKYGWVFQMISPCDNCAERQKSLDPEGCFHMHSYTGRWGRFIKMIFGCDYYRRLYK